MFIDNGVSSKLRETIPPVTIPSWPCLFSGITPYQLGYYWFIHPKKGLFNSNFWRDKAIFSIPSLKSFILNIPGTYPAWEINGEMITGMLSPQISYYPENLNFKYKNDLIIDGRNVHQIFKAFDIKKEIFLEKLEGDFNLLAYVIRMPDAISHHAQQTKLKTLNYIYLSYKKIDTFLGEILKNKNIDNIIIFSDHGLHNYKNVFYLRHWLKKKGFLKIETQSTTNLLKSLILKIYENISPFIKPNFFSKKVFTNLILKKEVREEKNLKHSDKIINKLQVQNNCSNFGSLFLYGENKLKKEVIEAELKKEKYVEEVITPTSNDFPDLFIRLNDDYYFNDEPSLFVKRKTDTIEHSHVGLFIAYGNKIQHKKLDFINYYDIAPTILKLFNISKKDYMSGKPLDIIKN